MPSGRLLPLPKVAMAPWLHVLLRLHRLLLPLQHQRLLLLPVQLLQHQHLLLLPSPLQPPR